MATDAAIQHLPIAERKSKILETVRFKKFISATAHRAENLAFTVLKISWRPSLRQRYQLFIQRIPHRKCTNFAAFRLFRLPSFDEKCEIRVIDSAGIQEEATAPYIRKSVLVTRLSTERPGAVEAGFAEVVGVEKHGIIKAIHKASDNLKELPEKSPYGEGKLQKRLLE